MIKRLKDGAKYVTLVDGSMHWFDEVETSYHFKGMWECLVWIEGDGSVVTLIPFDQVKSIRYWSAESKQSGSGVEG